MNLNYIILGIIIFVLILDIIFDFLRKNLDFLPEKGGHRFFLYFIYLFPLIITSFSPGYNKECSIFSLIKGQKEFNIFNSIKDNMSFYATALTITFAVYSFLETQKATEKDRKEREDQEKKKQEESKKREFELREKELEAQKDYYRPIFVVEEMEDSELQVKLLMKNEDLYLENVIVWNQDANHNSSQNIKHNNIIATDLKKLFFITGQTSLGETVLFTYINNIKIYKYLKSNISNSYYFDDFYRGFEKQWGSFNTNTKYDNEAWNYFIFKNTTEIIDYLFNKNNILIFEKSLESKSINGFYNDYFMDIKNQINVNTNSIKKYLEITSKLINYLVENLDIFNINTNEYKFLHVLYYYSNSGNIRSLNRFSTEANNSLANHNMDNCKQQILEYIKEYIRISIESDGSFYENHLKENNDFFSDIFEYIEFKDKDNTNKVTELQFILIEAYTLESDF